eukprot:767691-Pleurochrysis_carterae.AAC.1
MHDVPTLADLTSVESMLATTQRCDCLSTASERTARSHTPWNGQVLPCDRCSFGRTPSPNGESD